MDFKIFKSQEKKILIAGILLAVIFLYIEIAFILGPQLRALSAKALKLHQVGSRLSEYKKNFVSLKELQAQADASEAKNVGIEKNIFSDNDIPFILDTISQQASATGVKIMQMKPAAEAPSSSEKPQEAAGNLKFFPLAFSLSIISMTMGASSSESSRQLASVEISVYVNKK